MLDELVLGIGRFPKIVPMPVAATPATRRITPPSSSTFPSYEGLFVGLLVGTVLTVGGLAFFPALALCSVAGHVALRCGLFIGLLVGVALIGSLSFRCSPSPRPPRPWPREPPPSSPDGNRHYATRYRIENP